jgi:non-heme chloroperoxidase
MVALELRNATLVGFSIGTGEVTRYLGSYGSARVWKAALLGPIPPFLLKTDDNPEGVDQGVFDGIMAAIVADHPAYLKDFMDALYDVDKFRGSRDQRPSVADELECGRHRFPHWHPGLRPDLVDRLSG